MLAYKLFGAGMDSLKVAAMKDAAAGLTATGAVQGDAYEVTSSQNSFSTVAASTGAILDSDSAAGDFQVIYNGGANALLVYPPTGAQINALGANNPYSLTAASGATFFRMSSTLFVVIAAGGGEGGGDMLKSENLSGLTNYTTARSNMGLGSAATTSVAAYATSEQGALAASALQTNPALGTPVSGVATNLTGTAANLTAGNATLAATVTTNANLTGHVTSTGNAAILGSFTIAQLSTAISDANISGTNTGDDATNAQYSGLAASKQDTLVSGTNIKTINGATVLGAGDLVIASTPSISRTFALMGC